MIVAHGATRHNGSLFERPIWKKIMFFSISSYGYVSSVVEIGIEYDCKATNFLISAEKTDGETLLAKPFPGPVWWWITHAKPDLSRHSRISLAGILRCLLRKL